MNKLPYNDSSREDIFRYANELKGLEFTCVIERYLKIKGEENRLTKELSAITIQGVRAV